MIAPIEIRGDKTWNVYEVVYRRLAPGRFIASDQPVAPGVTAAIGPDGQIMSIELLTHDAATLAAVRAYASAHDLAFPDDPTDLGPLPASARSSRPRKRRTAERA